jgi:predicted metal-dependent phosphoesterase TrpH
MIDLHMHTNHSDGTYTTLELLKEADNANLNIISITDHQSVQAYYDIIEKNYFNIFKNKIIVGSEFATSFRGYTIELLGYGLDLDIVNKWSVKYKNQYKIRNKKKIIYSRLVDKVKKIGLSYNKIGYEESNKTADRMVYEELIKYRRNYEILGEHLLKNVSTFYRNGISNPISDMYICMADIDSNIEEIINLIHKAGGLVFIAHPYVYKMDDTISFLEAIVSKYKIDGIECFHSSFSIDESKELVKFCDNHNLYKCGGSDFHRNNKSNHKLGQGSDGTDIYDNVIDDWISKIKLFNE